MRAVGPEFARPERPPEIHEMHPPATLLAHRTRQVRLGQARDPRQPRPDPFLECLLDRRNATPQPDHLRRERKEARPRALHPLAAQLLQKRVRQSLRQRVHGLTRELARRRHPTMRKRQIQRPRRLTRGIRRSRHDPVSSPLAHGKAARRQLVGQQVLKSRLTGEKHSPTSPKRDPGATRK
jgi:hypothetical protein